MPPQSLSSNCIKSYRELLRKYHSGHLDDSPALQWRTQYLVDQYERKWLNADVSLQRTFAKVRQALLETDLRALYRDSKLRARQKLRDKLTKYKALYATTISSGPSRVASQQRSSAAQAGNTSATCAGALPVVAQHSPASTSSAAAVARAADSPHETERQQSNVSAVADQAQLSEIHGPDGHLRRAVLYLVGNASRYYMTRLNSMTVEGLEVMEAALNRPQGQALITVSNHVAAMDDPLVVANIIPPQTLEQPQSLRWTLCATDRCFKYKALVPFFQAAKVLPVQRGAGTAQPGMAAAEARLAAGDWVHIFPEGTRSRDGQLGAVRKGIGRLVAACPSAPLVVPFVHSGMEHVMPRGRALPATGQEVRVLVGQPVPVEDLLSAAAREGWSQDQLYRAVAARISTHLHALKHQLDTGEKVDLGLLAKHGDDELAAVSGLDLFDPSDIATPGLSREQRLRALWERVKFRMQTRSGALLPAAGQPGAAAAAAASAAAAGVSDADVPVGAASGSASASLVSGALPGFGTDCSGSGAVSASQAPSVVLRLLSGGFASTSSGDVLDSSGDSSGGGSGMVALEDGSFGAVLKRALLSGSQQQQQQGGRERWPGAGATARSTEIDSSSSMSGGELQGASQALRAYALHRCSAVTALMSASGPRSQ